MKALEAVLLTLRANAEAEASGGKSMFIGRTAMQKLVYFETVHTDVEAEYYGHYYGPFSEGVAEGIARLWEWGYVREDVPTPDYPGYTYSLTKDGDRLGTKVVNDGKREEYSKIGFVVGACREFCGLQQSQMSYAAKIHYMREHNKRPHAGVAEIVEMGGRAGWKMTAENVNAGLGLLGRLGFDR